MHSETQRELIEAATGGLGSLLKELFIHRKEMKQMERRKELEVELAEAKRGSGGDVKPSEPVATAPDDTAVESVGLGRELSEAFADLRAREQCGICRELLDAIEDADHRTQVVALSEYGKLKHAVETGADEAEIRDILEGSDALQDLLEEQVAA